MRVLALCLVLCAVTLAQQTVVNYHMGGSNTSPQNVPFTFSRSGDVTAVSWDQFGASADGAGVVYSSSSDSFPAGYPISNLYSGSVGALTRWTYIFDNGDGYLQISSSAPYVTFRPNTVSGVFSPAQIVTVRSGSLKYSNVNVVLAGTATNAALAASVTAASSTTAGQLRSAGMVETWAVAYTFGLVLIWLLL